MDRREQLQDRHPVFKHGSADFTDALELAVAAVQDDDFLLGGGSGSELTIDHIHALSTAPQPRASSYTDLAGGGGGSLYSSQPLPQGPTHIGDIIPVPRAASAASSLGTAADTAGRRNGSYDDEADSGVSGLPGSRRPAPSAASSRGSNRAATSTGSAHLSSTASSKGKLSRVATAGRPAPIKRDEPLSPPRPGGSSSRPTSARSPAAGGRASAGASPVKSAASSSSGGSGGLQQTTVLDQKAGSTRTSAVPGSRIPRPAGLPGPSTLRGADSPLQKAPTSPPKRAPSPPKWSASPKKGPSSPQKAVMSSQRSFGASPGKRVPSGAPSPATRPGLYGAGSGGFGAPGGRPGGRGPGAGGVGGRQPISPSKVDTRKQLEDIIRDLQDIKKDLGLPVEAPAAATAPPAEAAPPHAAVPGPQAIREEPVIATATSTFLRQMQQQQEASAVADTAAAPGNGEPAAAAVERSSSSNAGAASAARTASTGAEAAAAYLAMDGATSAASEHEVAISPNGMMPEVALPVAEEALPASTAAAYIESPAPPKALETSPAMPPPVLAVPPPAAAKQCCACSIM